ncbi:MAG TPA: polyprenyl diphosphate synthase [Bacillota bacterium]|nr:polyprenyl diphosphate synthase [Bacillota bacterium]
MHAELPSRPTPRHVAIIMDGNGRWAAERGKNRLDGHRAGIRAIRRTVEAARRHKLQVLTLYAFSTENWQRPPMEVRGLMTMLLEYLRREVDLLMEQGVRLGTLGDLGRLPPAVQGELRRAVDRTAANRDGLLNLALSYGGRDEIVRAARTATQLAATGRLVPDDLTEQTFAELLDTRGLPDPDLLIRTGGEHRVSNFLLWQLAYAELWFAPVYWPDFEGRHLDEAILEFQSRRRRYGGFNPESSVP